VLVAPLIFLSASVFPYGCYQFTEVLNICVSFRVPFPANSNFELGRGSNFSDWRPQLVPSLKSTRVIQVACGGYHSLALTGKLLEPAKCDISLTFLEPT
jgi:hypothetical protein